MVFESADVVAVVRGPGARDPAAALVVRVPEARGRVLRARRAPAVRAAVHDRAAVQLRRHRRDAGPRRGRGAERQREAGDEPRRPRPRAEDREGPGPAPHPRRRPARSVTTPTAATSPAASSPRWSTRPRSTTTSTSPPPSRRPCSSSPRASGGASTGDVPFRYESRRAVRARRAARVPATDKARDGARLRGHHVARRDARRGRALGRRRGRRRPHLVAMRVLASPPAHRPRRPRVPGGVRARRQARRAASWATRSTTTSPPTSSPAATGSPTRATARRPRSTRRSPRSRSTPTSWVNEQFDEDGDARPRATAHHGVLRRGRGRADRADRADGGGGPRGADRGGDRRALPEPLDERRADHVGDARDRRGRGARSCSRTASAERPRWPNALWVGATIGIAMLARRRARPAAAAHGAARRAVRARARRRPQARAGRRVAVSPRWWW